MQEINNYKDPNTLARDPIYLTMEIDYADGMARADNILAIFNSTGTLIGVAKDSNISDDVPRPLEGADMTDLSRGSVGRLDAFFGTTVLSPGKYYLAVCSNARLPTQLDQFFLANPTNPAVRLKAKSLVAEYAAGGVPFYADTADAPLTSYVREASNIPDPPIPPPPALPPSPRPLLTMNSPSDWSLSDVALYVNTGTQTFVVNPFTGSTTMTIGNTSDGNAHFVNDVAMRPDGRLFGFSAYVNGQLQPPRGDNTDANSGIFIEIDTGTGATTAGADDGITTHEDDPQNAGTTVLRNADQDNANRVGDGIQFRATSFYAVGSTLYLLAIGEAGNDNFTPNINASGDQLRNIMYMFDS